MSSQPLKAIPPSEKVPLKEKIAYGCGGLGGNIQSAADDFLLNPVFVIGAGVSPSIMSIAGLVYRAWDAITDALMGWISDRTSSRWGRRKPYILVGAILMGAWMPVLFFFNPTWDLTWIIAWMIMAQLGLALFSTIWNIPYQCLLLECTPNTHERTDVAAWRAYVSHLSRFGMSWVWFLVQLPIFYTATKQPDVLHGARWVITGLGVLVIALGLMPLFVKERTEAARTKKLVETSFRRNLVLTFKNRPFRLLIIFTVFLAIGTMTKSQLEFFTRLHYVCGGDTTLAAKLSGLSGTVSAFVVISGVPIFQAIARRTSKRKAAQMVMLCTLIAGVSTLIFYNPSYPYMAIIPSLLSQTGLTGLWVIIPSMTGDVVDHDELQTNERREGSFASTFSWFLKFSGTLAIALAGPLVDLAGYVSTPGAVQSADVIWNMRLLIVFVPTIPVALAIWVLNRYPLGNKEIEQNAQLLRERKASRDGAA